jgi:hypothetical protein
MHIYLAIRSRGLEIKEIKKPENTPRKRNQFVQESVVDTSSIRASKDGSGFS